MPRTFLATAVCASATCMTSPWSPRRMYSSGDSRISFRGSIVARVVVPTLRQYDFLLVPSQSSAARSAIRRSATGLVR
jgi:hypothetical protein